MIDAGRVWWRALRHLNQRGYVYIWANMLWFGLSLPVITAPAAWAGLIRLSRQAQTQPTVSLDEFWQGFRENLGRGAVMAVINLVVIVVNLINWRSGEFDVLRPLWIVILFGWLAVQFYLWPLLYELKEPSLTKGLRNAAVMALLNPGFTLGLWVGIIVVGGLSLLLVAAWPLVTAGLLAIVATSAVNDRLAAVGLRERPPDPSETYPDDTTLDVPL